MITDAVSLGFDLYEAYDEEFKCKAMSEKDPEIETSSWKGRAVCLKNDDTRAMPKVPILPKTGGRVESEARFLTSCTPQNGKVELFGEIDQREPYMGISLSWEFGEQSDKKDSNENQETNRSDPPDFHETARGDRDRPGQRLVS